MMMHRVMCVLAVVLCCACGYTMAAAAAVATDGQPKAVMAFDSFGDGDGSSKILEDLYPGSLPKPKDGHTDSPRGDQGQLGEPGPERQRVEGEREVTLHTTESHLPDESANGKGEYLVVTFEPITRATYDKYCKKNSSSIINGKNCSVLLKYLEAKAKLPPSPPKESKDADGHSNESGTGSHSGSGGVAAGNGEPQAAEVVQGSTGTEGNAITATPEGSNTAATMQNQNHETTAAPQTDNETSNTGNSATAAATTTPSPLPDPQINNTLTEAPTATPSPSPSPVPNAEISNIASTVQNKANVDSSVSPVWMRTTASLLIVGVLVSATVY